MRKLLYVFLLFAITSCAKKKWDKDYIAAECKKEMKKDKEMNQTLTGEQQTMVCDCSAEKAIAKYKSESEMKKDEAGAEAIGTECAMQVLMPNTPDTPVNPVDTTNQ